MLVADSRRARSELGWQPQWHALDDIIRAGKVRYVGCCNYSGVDVTDAAWTAKTLGLNGFISAQNRHNVIEARISRDLATACERHGIGADSMIEQLEAEAADKSAPARNPAELPLEELAAYIVETHHAYVRAALPRIARQFAKLVEVHGTRHPELLPAAEAFSAVASSACRR